MAHYIEHYESQIGGGIGRIYVGGSSQRGHGIGSFLGGLFRRAIPLIARGARALGRQFLHGGMGFMSDLDNNVPWKESLKSRAREAGQDLKRKAKEGIAKVMRGEGYKRPYGGMFSQSGLAYAPGLAIAGVSSKPSKTRRSSAKTKKKKKKSAKPAAKKKKASKTGKGVKKKKCCKKRAVTDIFGPV